MTAGDALSVDAAPPLVVKAQGSSRTLPAGPSYLVGRDPAADIVVSEPVVSWRHALLKVADGQWLLEDAGSTNGTFANGQRVERVRIADSCQVRLGHPDAGPLVSCLITGMPRSGADPAPSATAMWPRTEHGERHPTAIMPLTAKVLRIGRADDNDVVVADLRVSRRHAELRRRPGGEWEIVDLGSHNGTFLNGQQITTATVTKADVVGIGVAAFRLVGDELQEFVDAGDVSLDARGRTVTLPGGKVLLDDVSFRLSERCLLGVIGPSGAGKSTLLGALTGMRPATSGSVLYDGRYLY